MNLEQRIVKKYHIVTLGMIDVNTKGLFEPTFLKNVWLKSTIFFLVFVKLLYWEDVWFKMNFRKMKLKNGLDGSHIVPRLTMKFPTFPTTFWLKKFKILPNEVKTSYISNFEEWKLTCFQKDASLHLWHRFHIFSIYAFTLQKLYYDSFK